MLTYINSLRSPLHTSLQHEDEEDGEVYPYYVNEDTGESIWEHPLLEEFKAKFEKEKKRRQNKAKEKDKVSKDKGSDKLKESQSKGKDKPKESQSKSTEKHAAKPKASNQDDIVEEDFEEVSIDVPEVIEPDLYEDMSKGSKKGGSKKEDRWKRDPDERPEPDLSMPPGKKAIDSNSSEQNR